MLLLACSVFVNCKYVAKCVFQRSNELNMFINTCLFLVYLKFVTTKRHFWHIRQILWAQLAGAPRPRVFARDIKCTHIITFTNAAKKIGPLCWRQRRQSAAPAMERRWIKRLLSAKVCSFSGVCKQWRLQDRALIMCKMCLVLKDVFLGGGGCGVEH